ncbi:MAG TPA: tyrosine-type recombinase/integrase [Actinocatenispora sp.]
MARVMKKCDCPPGRWQSCTHPWIVRYRTAGGRNGRQREESFPDKTTAKDFADTVENNKRRRTVLDAKAGRTAFRVYAQRWIDQHTGAENSAATYRSVLNAHICPAFGDKPLDAVSREDIKALIAAMRRIVGPSRVHTAHLVISAVFHEAVLDKRLAETPCVDIPLPEIVSDTTFIFPTAAQLDALKAGLPADWAATIELMYGCGLRIGEALAANTRCRIGDHTRYRATEQVNQQAQLRPLKFRKAGAYRDTPLPQFVNDAITRHLDQHGTNPDGYLFRGRRHPLVVRRTYQEDFHRAVRKAGLPVAFTPHSLRHCFASNALAGGIPITDVSAWLGHRSIETTQRIYGHLRPESWSAARTILDAHHHALHQQAA